MEKNIFKLDNEQLKAIVCSFRDKTEEGLTNGKCRDTMHSYFHCSKNNPY